ncbi:MAG: UV DNA damage repair endonuclease UvsE [Bacillus sp. (in: Bacteria)]|nr:UV DNA damage repair endonuclease UvsE [Bacillus sp. (in: firmicutes)]
MKLGYACINTTLPTKFRTCRLATYEEKGEAVIKELVIHNLENVLAALKWNVEYDIYFYRISSEIVPLGSHEKMTWKWWQDEDILHLMDAIKTFKEMHNIRLSMHPGQFTVFSTPRQDVLERSFADLEYHDKVLELTGGTDMILHGGGKYGDMDGAKERFITNYERLSPSIRRKLRLENDDRTYTLQDVIDIWEKCHVPICFDIHHHNCHNNGEDLEPMFEKVVTSWKSVEGPIKVHISSGKTHEKDRSHHDFVFKQDFEALQKLLIGVNADIMVEAKQKEQAVLRIYEECFEGVPPV